MDIKNDNVSGRLWNRMPNAVRLRSRLLARKQPLAVADLVFFAILTHNAIIKGTSSHTIYAIARNTRSCTGSSKLSGT